MLQHVMRERCCAAVALRLAQLPRLCFLDCPPGRAPIVMLRLLLFCTDFFVGSCASDMLHVLLLCFRALRTERRAVGLQKPWTPHHALPPCASTALSQPDAPVLSFRDRHFRGPEGQAASECVPLVCFVCGTTRKEGLGRACDQGFVCFFVIWGWGWHFGDTDCCPAPRFHPSLCFGGGARGIS